MNIQTASVVIICEPQLKPSIENQAISRSYRMGQTRNVLVYRLLCENTVDERIVELLENKQAIFDAFADKSVAAEESMAIDDRTFGNIIEEEIERINQKNGRSTANVKMNTAKKTVSKNPSPVTKKTSDSVQLIEAPPQIKRVETNESFFQESAEFDIDSILAEFKEWSAT